MENKSSGGVGLSTLLLVLFVGLKLTGHINWSWWWVLAPLWIPLCFVVFVWLVVVVEDRGLTIKRSHYTEPNLVPVLSVSLWTASTSRWQICSRA